MLWFWLFMSVPFVFLIAGLVDYVVNRQAATAIQQHLQESSDAAEQLIRGTAEFEDRTEYIQLRHMLPWGKEREMARRIMEVEAEGWLYQKANA